MRINIPPRWPSQLIVSGLYYFYCDRELNDKTSPVPIYFFFVEEVRPKLLGFFVRFHTRWPSHWRVTDKCVNCRCMFIDEEAVAQCLWIVVDPEWHSWNKILRFVIVLCPAPTDKLTVVCRLKNGLFILPVRKLYHRKMWAVLEPAMEENDQFRLFAMRGMVN